MCVWGGGGGSEVVGVREREREDPGCRRCEELGRSA